MKDSPSSTGKAQRMADRQDLPLLLASDAAQPNHEREPLDRLRMQKGVFILQQSGPGKWRNLFKFIPWDWGPFSRELDSQVTTLRAEGLLTVEQVPYRRYPRYATTAEGEERARNALSELSDEERTFLLRVRSYVTSRSFSQLLREVYTKYPGWDSASRFHF